MIYYVYRNEDNVIVDRIVGEDNVMCEAIADERWDSNDYSGTYSPAVGFVSGCSDPDGLASND